MKDNYAGLYNAETEEEACEQAVEQVTKDTEHLALSKAEKRFARTVVRVEKIGGSE
jgi:hypothetical protein